MKQLFLPRRLRYHLPQSVQNTLKWVAVTSLILSLFLGGFVIHNEHEIKRINLLKNKELLMLKVKAKRDPEILKEYTAVQRELSNRYVQQRTTQQFIFTGFVISLGLAVALFKVRKNLRKK